MLLIPLSNLPNQTISFNADGAFWELHFYQAIDHMYADVALNGVTIIQGTRCLGGIGVLPYNHLHEPKYGNFVFDNIVDWNNFGSTCLLYYMTLAEWNEYRALIKV